jgi:endo-1,4-beta-D-glucanase Y
MDFVAGDKTLVRVSSDGNGTLFRYRSSTQLYTLRVRHSTTKATDSKPSYERHNVEFIVKTFATSTDEEFDRKVYVVFEQLASDTDVTVINSLAEWLMNTANANTIKVLNGEG